MSILVLQVFVSLILVAGALVLFAFTVSSRTLEHADRLALAPLDDDGPVAAKPTDSTSAPIDSSIDSSIDASTRGTA